MKRNKILSVIMLIFLMCNCLCPSAFGSEILEEEIPSVSDGAGAIEFTAGVVNEKNVQQIKVPVVVSNNSGFSGFKMVIGYDYKLLRPVEVLEGDVLRGNFEKNIDENGIIEITYDSENNVMEKGEVLEVVFRVTAQKSFNTPIDISVVDVVRRTDDSENITEAVSAVGNLGNVIITYKSPTSGGGGGGGGSIGGSYVEFVSDCVNDKLSSTVKVPVRVNNNSGFAGFTMEISYDSSLLKPIDVYKNAVLNGFYAKNLSYGDGVIKVTYASQNDITTNGKILDIEFKVLSKTDFSTPVEISVYDVVDAENNEINARGINCEVTMIKTPIKAEIQSNFYNGGTWGVTTSWENLCGTELRGVRLYIATYKENGSLIEMLDSYYDFLPYERISFETLLTNDDIYTIKLMAWTENMNPVADGFEKVYKKAVISQYMLIPEEDKVNYTMLVDKFEYSGDDDLQLYVTAYEAGKLIGISVHDVNFTGSFASIEGSVPRNATSIKCYLWTKDTLSPVDTKNITLNKVNVIDMYCAQEAYGVSYSINFERFTAYENEEFDVFIAGYDSDNKLVNSTMQNLKFYDKYASIEGFLYNNNIAKVKCLVWQKNTMKPVTDTKESGVN